MKPDHAYAEPVVTDANGEWEARALAREFTWEQLEAVRRLSDIGQRFLEIGDDVGARYTLQRIVAHVKSATGAFKEMPTSKEAA